MALIHWEPVAELNTIQSEMNRLFTTFFDQSGQSRGTDAARSWIPAMDLVEARDDYVLRADLPGLSDADVSIQFQDNVLTISGERRPEHEHEAEGYFRIERAAGAFSRSLSLPDGVDPDSVQAHFDRGVLEVRIPKPAQKKPRSVSIALGSPLTRQSRAPRPLTRRPTSATLSPPPYSQSQYRYLDPPVTPSRTAGSSAAVRENSAVSATRTVLTQAARASRSRGRLVIAGWR